MQRLDPYTTSHVIAAFLGGYSLLLLITWNRWTKKTVDKAARTAVVAAWLSLVALIVYVRGAGNAW